jgi:hypothetical protein
MSDGREEREEQEQRRKWEKEKKDRDENRARDWERDGEPERRDSRAAEVEALDAALRAQSAQRTQLSNCGCRGRGWIWVLWLARPKPDEYAASGADASHAPFQCKVVACALR